MARPRGQAPARGARRPARQPRSRTHSDCQGRPRGRWRRPVPRAAAALAERAGRPTSPRTTARTARARAATR
eukprot:6276711-Alexandrium_andersonii.AAC.1